jgi:hypothetical protein
MVTAKLTPAAIADRKFLKSSLVIPSVDKTSPCMKKGNLLFFKPVEANRRNIYDDFFSKCRCIKGQ